MVLKTFTIRDSKGEFYSPSFFQKTHGEAERSFKQLVQDRQSQVSKFPEDYDLYYIGEFGEKNKRPHWHVILLNYRPKDATYKYTTDKGEKVYDSQEIQQLWKKGQIEFGSVTLDSAGYAASGWFIPWEHLIQFFAPDFFGNPSTLNYFGVWNYGELVGYVGIVPLIFSFFALFFRKDRNVLFFGSLFFVSLIFSLPTFIAKIPFQLSIPFLQTAQPTRLLFVVDFSLAVLAALGMDRFLKDKKGIIFPVGFLGLIILSLWIFVAYGGKYLSSENIIVAKNNLLLPTLIFSVVITIFLGYILFEKKNKLIKATMIFSFIAITFFDLTRFGWKFNSFVRGDYIFPQTHSIDFLQKNIGNFRIMSVDSRILPPNFSAFYKIQSLDIYDPLYLLRYGLS